MVNTSCRLQLHRHCVEEIVKNLIRPGCATIGEWKIIGSMILRYIHFEVFRKEDAIEQG